MRKTPSTPERCSLLLNNWRKSLNLSNKEKSQLYGELITLDRQIERLIQRELRIAVFGKVGVGKSSLLNALINKTIFKTDVAHGSTRKVKGVIWKEPIKGLKKIELLDTPGIDEISATGRARLAARVAIQADLILLVLEGDITNLELKTIRGLLTKGKPILIVLNQCDKWSPEEQSELLKSIRSRLPKIAGQWVIKAISAAPRRVKLLSDGRIRSHKGHPQIKPLRTSLTTLLKEQGELLLALNSLKQADYFCQSLKRFRLRECKVEAQGIIGKFAAIKASGVAANQIILLDLAGGLACDTALVIKLCKLYGIQINGPAARKLMTKLSGYNALIGGAQISIQFLLSLLKSLLIITSPITGGLSLATAGPIALIQAALAVHTTKLTGRLTAEELVQNHRHNEAQPKCMLKRLEATDPAVKNLIKNWPFISTNQTKQLRTFLP